MRKPRNFTISRSFPSGAWECFGEVNGEYVRMSYFFYTKKEAIAEFRALLKEKQKGK